MKNELSRSERMLLESLISTDRQPVLDWEERVTLNKALNYIYELETHKAWESPYRRAIGVLEKADAAFMGNPS